MIRDLLTQASYLAACAFFIVGLRSLTRPDTARRGMQQAAAGMLLAIVGTLIVREIVEYQWIVAGLVVGTVIGLPLGTRVPMTAMPQRIAVSHLFGAMAAALVGAAKYLHLTADGHLPRVTMGAIGFEVLFGTLTVTGSFMAFGKLQEFLPGKPITYRGQNVVNVAAMAGAVGLWVYLLVNPYAAWAFWAMMALAFVIGISFVLPIGGADMPVVVSLLNSYAGLAASATGFAIGNNVLIVAGALDGASGFILSVMMAKAMNRSFSNVLFGAFGATPTGTAKSAEGLTARSVTADEAAMQIAYADRMIVVPGYGLAVAQAQHVVAELAELVEKRGGEVKFAIHPVAGRMPGHMNVLLAEANVPYDKLLDMDEINDQFGAADVALVIGANDVVNPAARNDPTSAIYGMPILNVDQARQVFVLKRSMGAGYAGVENELFYLPNTAMLFGDAKQSLTKLVAEVKAL